jgi:ABC-type multidrug transport system permease subunit
MYPLATTPTPPRTSTLIADSLVLARRNLEHVRQLPEKLLDVTLQPVMFVLLFAFVFGKVIAIPGGNYREYLLGGILVQSLGFGVMGPAVSIATDLKEGVVDRLRTLPMSRAAYLIGHVIAELGALAIAITILSLTGLVVGWGIYSDVPHAIAGYGLILLFAFTMLWCGTLLGLIVRSPDAAQGVVFMVIFPMTFLATTFVPITGFDGVLHTLASWNPISAMAAAIRTLFGNPTATPAGAPWPLVHCVTVAVGWCLALLAITVPLTIRTFRARTDG